MSLLSRLLTGMGIARAPRKRRPSSDSTGRGGRGSRRHSPPSTQGKPPRAAATLRQGCVIAYHGTPSVDNATSIIRHGWMVARAGALGDGVYLADMATAKGYAGSAGVLLKCRLRLGRTCLWDAHRQQEFDHWCRQRQATADNSARTAFLLQRGYHSLQSGTVIVMLSPFYGNPTAWKVRPPGIRVLGVFQARDGRRVHV